MDSVLIFNLLFILHLMALVAGGATAMTMPIMGGLMASATPEQRATMFKIGNTMVRNARVALVVLLITGPLMVWVKFGGFGGLSPWFWVKMALVVVLLVGNIVGGINYKKAQTGDRDAAKLAQQVGMVNSLAFLGIIISAVFAFN